MLGVGLDFAGRKRITTGENFALVVGSQEMHEQMTEKALRISEKLKARCKQLETVTDVLLFSAEDSEIFHGYIFRVRVQRTSCPGGASSSVLFAILSGGVAPDRCFPIAAS
jgi:hypothetical protein